MFSGFDKHNHAGLLAGVPRPKPGASQAKGSRFDVQQYLPAGSSEILDAKELPAQKDPKLAAAVAQYFGTAAVAEATTAEALAQYLEQLAPAVEPKLTKDVGDLNRFLSGLRAWVWFNEVYQLAANDFDNDEQTKKVKEAADEAVRLLTDSKDKALAAGLVELYAAAKKAQTKLMELQTKGVCEIPIYEWHGPGFTETTYTQWIGSVPLRPEVKNDKGFWPIPPCTSPWTTTPKAVNPIFKGNIPGLADYLPFDKVSGSANPLPGVVLYGAPLNKLYPQVDMQLVQKIIADQAARLKAKNTLDTTGVGDWVLRCVAQDPEFSPKVGWKEVVKGIGSVYATVTTLGTYQLVQSAFSNNKAAREAAPRAIDAVRALQEKYRNSQPVLDAVAQCNATLQAIRGSVVAVCNQIPPVPVKRTLNKQAGLILPYMSWDAWRNEIKDVPTKTIQNQIKGFGWWTDTPDIVNTIFRSLEAFYPQATPLDKKYFLLQNWEAGQPSPWPLTAPIGFNPAFLPGVAKKTRAEADAALAKLTGTQQEWAIQRGSIKASLLLAQKLTELGKKSKSATDAMSETLSQLGDLLYGCSLPEAPTGLSGKALLAWYNEKLLNCAQNPTPDSLMGQLNVKLAQYEKTKDPAIKKEIDALAEKIGNVTSRRGSRRGKVVANTTDAGGTLPLTEQSNQALQKGKEGTVKLPDGKTVQVGATQTEKEKAQATNQTNKDIVDATKNTLGYVDGSGTALKDINTKVPGALPPVLNDQIDKNKEDVKQIVDPTQPKKSSPPWLLLFGLGAAAVAATKK